MEMQEGQSFIISFFQVCVCVTSLCDISVTFCVFVKERVTMREKEGRSEDMF